MTEGGQEAVGGPSKSYPVHVEDVGFSKFSCRHACRSPSHRHRRMILWGCAGFVVSKGSMCRQCLAGGWVLPGHPSAKQVWTTDHTQAVTSRLLVFLRNTLGSGILRLWVLKVPLVVACRTVSIATSA